MRLPASVVASVSSHHRPAPRFPAQGRPFGERELAETVRRLFAPPPEAIARMERIAIAAFRSSFCGPTVRPGHRVALPRRLVAAVLLATALAGVTGVAYAASGPGQPFYPVRLSLERAMLPAVDSAARADAEVDLLRRRLDEATAATDRADRPAVRASLAAYRDGVVELRDFVLSHPAMAALAARQLEVQWSVLRGLDARTSGETRDDLADAMTVARQTLRSLWEIAGHRHLVSGHHERLEDRTARGSTSAAAPQAASGATTGR